MIRRLLIPNKSFILALFILFQVCIYAHAGIKKETVITGTTMGTFYKVKYLSDLHGSVSQEAWKQKIETRLKELNAHLNMYDSKSELTVFNQSPAQTHTHLSLDFNTVLQTAGQLHQITNGAWDGTIKPLVDLWGFGTKKKTDSPPDPVDIQKALDQTGFNHLKRTGSREIFKQNQVTLDFGSIAKGYGVDAIARLFISGGITDVLVEIGGELYGSGKNKKDRAWTVGISRPDPVFAKQNLYKVIRLDNQAIATSGNYRNFYEIDEITYSHIIDPQTGYPVQNKIVSASVISKDCTFADGLATALMVMDVNKGIELVNTLEGTECLIVQKIKGRFIDHTSAHFNRLIVK